MFTTRTTCQNRSSLESNTHKGTQKNDQIFRSSSGNFHKRQWDSKITLEYFGDAAGISSLWPGGQDL